jgi:ABC-type branched-subunit amino acid transport system substrate-binding protein
VRRIGLRLAIAGLLGVAAAARAAPEPIRIAWIGPLSGPLAKAGEESLLGARLAAEAWSEKRPVEVVPFDDREDPKTAEALLAEAQKGGKFLAAVAMPTGVTAAAVAARARRGHLPVIFAGSAPPPNPTVDPEDPVLFVGAWPVDQAINLATFLAVHSTNAGIGLYRDCLEPALVVEDTERGRELADALARNLGPRQHLSGRVTVPPHGAPSNDELNRLRAARCDRLVLIGEPDLVDRTAEAMGAVNWEVPIFCTDGMLSLAAGSVHGGALKKANFLYGAPEIAQLKTELPADTTMKYTPADELRLLVEKRLGAGSRVYPRTRNAWLAAWLALRATEPLSKPGENAKHATRLSPLEALRTLAFTREEERECPYFDVAGRGALYQWFVWTMGAKGPEPIRADYLPVRDRGPVLRMKKPQDWDAVEINDATQVVWLTFGEKDPTVHGDPLRTIEEDMGSLGLGTMGYEGEMDPWLLEELQVRMLGKINRLFLKNYDGTFVPGVSFNIHFTFTKPEKLKPNHYWVGIIGGEEAIIKDKDPEKEAKKEQDLPGGKVIGSGRVAIYSRWMRKYTDIKNHPLRPHMNRDDRKYLDGTYSWGTTYEENLRADAMKCVLDGYSSWFAMTGAHEFGHVCGCGHDTESSRSIMNVVDAVGLRDTQACWIPMHVKALENSLGRYPGGKRK